MLRFWPLLLCCACRPLHEADPARAGALDVRQDSLSLGPVGMDQVAREELVVANYGDAGVDVSVALTGADFALAAGGSAAALSLAAGDTALLGVIYTPSSAEPAEGVLVVTPDAADVFATHADPFTVALSGLPEPDTDGDGHDHLLAGGDDCDDRDATVFPGAQEAWYDGTDQDCDGADDDQDGDGYGVALDCDDTDAAVYPDAGDDTLDGVDSDCDDRVDDEAIEGLAGALVLTEYLAKSSSIPDAYGQWLEFWYKGSEPLDLEGIRLRSGAGTGTVYLEKAVEPASWLVLCAEVDPDENGGITCDGYARPWPTLNAEEDALDLLIPLRDPYDNVVDRVLADGVAWDESWPHETGAAVQLHSGQRDAAANDEATWWCLAETAAPSGDYGTPGAENHPCAGAPAYGAPGP